MGTLGSSGLTAGDVYGLCHRGMTPNNLEDGRKSKSFGIRVCLKAFWVERPAFGP